RATAKLFILECLPVLYSFSWDRPFATSSSPEAFCEPIADFCKSLDCFPLKEFLASDSLTSAAIIAAPVKRATGAGHSSSSSSVSLIPRGTKINDASSSERALCIPSRRHQTWGRKRTETRDVRQLNRGCC